MISVDEKEPEKHKGIILAPDDIELNQYICVHSIKGTKESAPILGQSLHVKAINLPYVVGMVLSDPSKPVITLDYRYLNFMKVTPEYVKAQEDGAGPQPRKRKLQPPE